MQSLLTRALEKGVPHVDRNRGRFRNDLIRGARNAAIAHLRTQQRRDNRLESLEAETLAGAEQSQDKRWDQRWRACLWDRVWIQPEERERSIQGDHASSVLRLKKSFGSPVWLSTSSTFPGS